MAIQSQLSDLGLANCLCPWLNGSEGRPRAATGHRGGKLTAHESHRLPTPLLSQGCQGLMGYLTRWSVTAIFTCPELKRERAKYGP